MAGLFPRLTPEGRRFMMRLAVVVGLAGAALAAWRRDYAGAALILVALAAIAGVYLWSGAGRRRDGEEAPPHGGDGEDGSGKDPDGRHDGGEGR